MLKKILSSALAICMVFGTAAVLPEGYELFDTAMTVSAEDETVYKYGDFTYQIKDNGTIKIKRYTGESEKLIIPAKINGKAVTEIGDIMLFRNFWVKDITLPSSIDTIAGLAFYYAFSLENIYVDSANNHFSSINGVLYNKTGTEMICCPGEKETLTIGPKVTKIEKTSISDGRRIQSIEVDKNNKTFASYDSVIYSKDMKTLIVCPNTKETVTIPKGVKEIEHDAFYCCERITGIVLPDGVEMIGEGAFQYSGLKTIRIPDTVKFIGFRAFDDCPLLDDQNGLIKYADNIAVDCDESITTAAFKEGTRKVILNDGCDKYKKLKTVNIPDSVDYIGGFSFEQCPVLSEVKLGSGLKGIGDGAFYQCPSLKIVTVPKSVKSIGEFSLGYSLICPFGIHEKYDDFSIKCYNGSAAYTYAKENKINYQLIDAQSISKAAVSGLSNKTYTGKAIKQTPVVKLSGKALKSGTDYTVSYKNNKAVGTATVTITGKGAYTGTAKATFKILPKKTTLKTAKSPKTKQLKVTYSKVAGVTGYQVTYSTSSKFTKATTKSVNVKGTSKTISKLTKGKTYYVKVRTYKTVGKTKFYSGYSAVKKVKVK